MRVSNPPRHQLLAIAILLLLAGAVMAPTPVLAQGVSWGDIVKWLSPKRSSGGTRSLSPICLLNEGQAISVLTPRPTIFWRGGGVKSIGLRKTGTLEKLLWEPQRIDPGKQSLTYSGPTLEAGQSYDWVFFNDSKGKSIRTFQTITLVSKADSTKILGEMSQLSGKGEAKTLEQLNYLIQNGMPADAMSKVMQVLPSASAEFKQTAETLKTMPCREEKKSEK
jgi:hypothetical protein